ncbi:MULTISPECIES: hypothetical protein [unclassified Pseudomonas]|uniref:hypothetical protein n=1 Tax=unclassified Pseudomonas TaxID=196821 RepID=UPI001358F6E1|nr:MULTISPECIES: hypothetical protein [unclassified Pseudomonas]WNZ84807.1 hypothetical protein QOM10_02340 [Pseudomonas sp. P108]
MDTLIYSNKDVGFSSKLSSPQFDKSATREQREKPALGFLAFISGEFVVLRETEKWGAVLPMEIIKTLPVMMAVSTRKSDIGARITLHWVSTDDLAKASFGPFDVSVAGNVEFIRLSLEQLEPFSGKSVNVTAEIKLPNGVIENSPALLTDVTRELNYQPAIIEGLVDGGIDAGTHPQGRLITIPVIEHLRPYNTLLLQWRVYAGNEKVFDQSVELQANRPEEAFMYSLPAQAYSPFKGFKGEFQCWIQLGTEIDSRLLWSTGISFFDIR